MVSYGTLLRSYGNPCRLSTRCLRLIVATPLIASPPPLVLSTLHRLLSVDTSPPICLLFASWLCRRFRLTKFALLTSCSPAGCRVASVVAPPPPLVLFSRRLCLTTSAPLPCDAPPPPPVAPPLLVRWRLSSRLPLVHRLVVMSHLVTPPPHAHVPILDPRLHAHCLVVPSHLVGCPCCTGVSPPFCLSFAPTGCLCV
jgi:hypothetical protein